MENEESVLRWGGLAGILAFIVLGVAMLGAPAFGRRFGGVSIVLGVIGIAVVVASLFVVGETGKQLMGVAVLANIVFLPLFGWKAFRLSRATGKS